MHDVFVKTRNLIDKNWSCRGAGCSFGSSSVCLEEALSHALEIPLYDEGFQKIDGKLTHIMDIDYERVEKTPEYAFLHALLRELHPEWPEFSELFVWNDHVNTTKQMVLDLLGEAVKRTAPQPDLNRAYLDETKTVFSTGPVKLFIDNKEVTPV